MTALQCGHHILLYVVRKPHAVLVYQKFWIGIATKSIFLSEWKVLRESAALARHVLNARGKSVPSGEEVEKLFVKTICHLLARSVSARHNPVFSWISLSSPHLSFQVLISKSDCTLSRQILVPSLVGVCM